MRAVVFGGMGALALAGLIAACAPDTKAATARSDYKELCAECHGPSGRGNGPLAEGMDPKPTDITQVAAMNGGTFPKNRVMSHIYGFTPGRSESSMPQFGDLMDGRKVMYDAGDGIKTPTPWRLVALMEYVEGLQE